MSRLYYVTYVISFCILCVFSYFSVNISYEINLNDLPFTHTNYDFIVNYPTEESINKLQNLEEVYSVYPFQNVEVNLKKDDITESFFMLFNETMNGFDNTFFNNDLLLDGAYDENQIMIDKFISTVLNLKVGDTVSYRYNGLEYTNVIGAIYAKVSFGSFNYGVAMCKAPFHIEKYTGMFVSSNDSQKTIDYLNENIFSFTSKDDVANIELPKSDSDKEKLLIINLIVIFLIPFLIVTCTLLINIFNKKELKLYVDNGFSYKSINLLINKKVLIATCSLIFMHILFLLSIINTLDYNNFSIINVVYIHISLIISMLFVFISNRLLIKKIIQNKE